MKSKSRIASLLIFTALFTASCGNTPNSETSEIKESEIVTTAAQTTFTELVTTEDSSKPETTTETTVSMELETTVDKQEEKRPEHYFSSTQDCYCKAAEFYCGSSVKYCDNENTVFLEDGQKLYCKSVDTDFYGFNNYFSDLGSYYLNTDDLPEGFDGELVYDPERADDTDYIVKEIDPDAELPILECVWRKAEEISGEKAVSIKPDVMNYIVTTDKGHKYMTKYVDIVSEKTERMDKVKYSQFKCYGLDEYIEHKISQFYPDTEIDKKSAKALFLSLREIRMNFITLTALSNVYLIASMVSTRFL
jgi:hypothetical protein